MASGILRSRGTPCILVSFLNFPAFLPRSGGVALLPACRTPLPAAAEGMHRTQPGGPHPSLPLWLLHWFKGQWWWGWASWGWEGGALLPEEVFSESPSLRSFQR